MRKITKKTIKRIKAGYHDDLMEAIEFLIDSYDEDKADAGYRMALEDMAVRSYRLAEHILKQLTNHGVILKLTPRDIGYDNFNTDNLATIIEEYFTNALKE